MKIEIELDDNIYEVAKDLWGNSGISVEDMIATLFTTAIIWYSTHQAEAEELVEKSGVASVILDAIEKARRKGNE